MQRHSISSLNAVGELELKGMSLSPIKLKQHDQYVNDFSNIKPVNNNSMDTLGDDNQFGFLNHSNSQEIAGLSKSFDSNDSLPKEQNILVNLDQTQMDVIKAINLGDYNMLAMLGVTGLNIVPMINALT